MSDLYKSPIGILLFLLEVASAVAMIYTLDRVFDDAWAPAMLAVGVILMTILGIVFALIADTWVGTAIGIALAAAITSPIFYYVWTTTGWPAGGFLCIGLIHGGLRTWRKEAESA